MTSRSIFRGLFLRGSPSSCSRGAIIAHCTWSSPASNVLQVCGFCTWIFWPLVGKIRKFTLLEGVELLYLKWEQSAARSRDATANAVLTHKAFCWGLCRVLPAPTIPQCAGCTFLVFCTGWTSASLNFCLWLKHRMVCFKNSKLYLVCIHVAIEIWSWKTERKKEREQEF